MSQISDFGLATLATVHLPKEKGKFPIKWTAPEALKDGVSGKSVVLHVLNFFKVFLREVRCVEFWYTAMGNLFIWKSALPINCK